MSEAVAAPVPGSFDRPDAPPSEAFESLYRRTFPRVYGYVASLVRDRSAAEEVTAQAFERAYRKRRTFRTSRGTEEAWIFGIARNAALDELRRRKRRVALEAEPHDLDQMTAQERAESALRRRAVRDRELVALKFFAGLSHDEIARVLRTTPTNVGTRLHRTLERLRKECDEDA